MFWLLKDEDRGARLVLKELCGIIMSIQSSHHKLLLQKISICKKKRLFYLFTEVLNLNVIVEVGILEDGSHVVVAQIFKLKSVQISKPMHYGASQKYSCPCLVVDYTEELISRTFLDENRFRLVSQDRMSA